MMHCLARCITSLGMSSNSRPAANSAKRTRSLALPASVLSGAGISAHRAPDQLLGQRAKALRHEGAGLAATPRAKRAPAEPQPQLVLAGNVEAGEVGVG